MMNNKITNLLKTLLFTKNTKDQNYPNNKITKIQKLKKNIYQNKDLIKL